LESIGFENSLENFFEMAKISRGTAFFLKAFLSKNFQPEKKKEKTFLWGDFCLFSFLKIFSGAQQKETHLFHLKTFEFQCGY